MTLSRRTGGRLFELGLLLVGAAPWLLTFLKVESPFVRHAYAPLCHQLPERTLLLQGLAMPICSRCAGIYAGLVLGVLACIPRSWLGAMPRVVTVAAAAMALDVSTQALGLHAPWHPSRLATGLALGWSVTAWLVRTLREDATPRLNPGGSPSMP